MLKISELDFKPDLNDDLWSNGRLREEIQNRLMKIAQEFYEKLNITEGFEDIRITGSMAGYNWTENSDIDLHILVDFTKFGNLAPLLKDYFDTKRNQWNRSHNITIWGHEVEIYVQDENEEHFSPGQYSILRREWVERPEKSEKSINFKEIKKKSTEYARKIDHIIDLHGQKSSKSVHTMAHKLINKLKR